MEFMKMKRDDEKYRKNEDKVKLRSIWTKKLQEGELKVQSEEHKTNLKVKMLIEFNHMKRDDEKYRKNGDKVKLRSIWTKKLQDRELKVQSDEHETNLKVKMLIEFNHIKRDDEKYRKIAN